MKKTLFLMQLCLCTLLFSATKPTIDTDRQTVKPEATKEESRKISPPIADKRENSDSIESVQNESKKDKVAYEKKEKEHKKTDDAVLIEKIDVDQFLVGDEKRDKVLQTAFDLIGTPYRYGGSTPGGFDCSGFVLYVYKQQGITLPRTSNGQFHCGKSLADDGAKPGDLLFFTTRRGKPISHVAIYLGNGLFVHAPSKGKRVSISSLQSDDYWKYRFYGSCTILESDTLAFLSK